MDDLTFGLLLFGGLMVFVFGINYFTQRVDIDKVSQEKKNKYLTWFWYFYGVFFLTQGVRYIFFENKLGFGLLWVIISITTLIQTYRGKIFSSK